MLYLLDTNVVSDLMEVRPQVRARLDALPPSDSVVVCTIVRGEILFGIEKLPAGKRRNELARRADETFAQISCEEIPQQAADAYARIKNARAKAGTSLDDNDLWIAATARALDAILVTRDRALAGIDGLTTQDWNA